MSRGVRKLLAFLIICLTAVGIIFSIFLIFQVWHYRQPVTEKLQSNLDQFTSVLQITDDGLVVIDQVVKNVYTSTLYLDEATQALSQTVMSTSSFMDTAGTFVGDNLMSTITNTQTALGSAQASARVIDNILNAMSHIPLIGITYNPAVPLNTALGDVASSLDPLQTTLKNFQTNLEKTSTNMQDFSGQISDLNKNILTMQKNLNQAKVTINKYRQQVNSLKSWLVEAKTNLQGWVTTAAWVLSIIIVWLVIIQIAIMLQGFTVLTSDRVSQNT